MMVVRHPDVREGGLFMFAHFCTVCRQRRLVFSTQVTTIVNDERGVHVHFTCWCGAEQTLDTGRPRHLPRPTVAA
jgi:hypothetical protein